MKVGFSWVGELGGGGGRGRRGVGGLGWGEFGGGGGRGGWELELGLFTVLLLVSWCLLCM